MTTLITGGTGLIGAALADKLLARGERVVLFDVAPAEIHLAQLRAYGDHLRIVRGDVQSLGELIDAIRRHDVTAIVHLAYLLGAEANLMAERATAGRNRRSGSFSGSGAGSRSKICCRVAEMARDSRSTSSPPCRIRRRTTCSFRSFACRKI